MTGAMLIDRAWLHRYADTCCAYMRTEIWHCGIYMPDLKARHIEIVRTLSEYMKNWDVRHGFRPDLPW